MNIPEEVKYAGVPVKVGDTTFVVPPLTFKHLKRLGPQLSQLPQNGKVDLSTMDAFMDVILCAMQRNYPDITEEELGDIVDISNMTEFLLAAMNASGLVATKKTNDLGEATAKGSPGESSTL